MSFYKNLLLFVLSVQEKILTKKLNKTLGVKHFSKRKNKYNDGCLLTLDSIAESEKQKMEEELFLILKSYNYEPKEILNYIEKHDTKVFYLKNERLLNIIGEEFGFIYPQKGMRALFLGLITEKKILFKTNDSFIVSSGNINQYYFIYNFYNWYAYKHGIEGLDTDTQKLLNKFLSNPTNDDFSQLQLAEIYKLKDAIKQDKSAIEFVFKLCQRFEATKKAMEKIKDDGAII